MIEYKSSVDIAANLSVKGRITSRLADGGLSPLDVLSKVLNVNLNAEFLGGYDAIKFPRKIENAAITGTWGFLFAPTITTASTAPTAAARYDQITALSGVIDARTITINGTAGRVSVTGGTQSLAANRTWSVDLAASGVVAGTGTKVVVDTYGRVTGFVSATTVAAYGITDILAQVLTGYTAGSNTAISSSDTILQAFGKVQGQINNISTTGITGSGTAGKIMKFTGTRTAGDSIMTESSINITVAGNIICNYPAGSSAGLVFQSGGASRWEFKKYGATSGSNSGDNIGLYAVDDAGAGLGYAFTIARSTRKFTFEIVPSGPGPSSGSDYVNLTYANATYVPLTRTVTASTGLTGGGALSGNISLSVSYGTTAGTAAQGNDSRINNGQTAFGWGNHTGLYFPASVSVTDLFSVTGDKFFSSSVGSPTNGPVGGQYGAGFQVSATGNPSYINRLAFAYAGSLHIQTKFAGVDGSWDRVTTASMHATLTRGTGLTGSNYTPTSASTFAVDFGTGTNQASRGDHTHANLTAGTGLSGTAYNGSTGYTWSLASGVVAPGTYQKITLDTYGRGIAGANLSSSDIITALGYTPGSGSGSIGGGGTSGYVAVFQAGGVNIQNSRLYDSGSGRVATVSGAGFQSAGDILAGGDIDCGVNTLYGNKVATNVAEFANTLVVGGSSIGSGLAFEVRGTTKASRPFPKMTRAQRLALSPSEGDFVFQTEIVGASARGVKYYDGTTWLHMDYNGPAA